MGSPFPGSAHAVVAGVPCAALPLPSDWATQASLSAVPDVDLVEVATEVITWLARHGRAGWQLEAVAEQAPVVADALGLSAVREHQVWVSAAEPPELADFDVDVQLGPPADEEEFLEVFGPDLAPMIRGQLARPDWEVAVLRHAQVPIGCLRLMDLADTTYIGGLGVRSDRRGQGLGRALGAAATRRARRRSDLVWLHCDPSLGPFYAQLGYTLHSQITFLGPGSRPSPTG